jgi:hypothetical protein
METADTISQPQKQATFGLADALFASAKSRLSTGELMHSGHDEVERYVREQGRRIMQALLQEHFVLRGLASAKGPVVGADGRARTHARPDTVCRLVTTVGDEYVPRTAHSGRGLSALHPVDAELNLPKQGYSFEVQRLVAKTAAEVSFARAGELFREYCGLGIGLRQVEEIARASALDMSDFYREMSRGFLGAETSPLLVGTVDQKGVIMRRDSLRSGTAKKAAASQPRLESRLTSGEKPNRKRMTTVAAVYTVSPFVRTAEEVIAGLRHLRAVEPKKSGCRPRPEYKRVWASLEADVPTVVKELFDELERRDPHQTKQWIIPIDGDEKLERAIRKEANCRGVKVTIVLDFIHALEYIWKAGHVFFEAGSEELEAWVLEHLKRMLDGKAAIVAAAMRRMATTRGLSSKKRKQVDESANYLLKRQKLMQYDELLAIGAPISSGVIEGTCRSLINDRLGLTGARWGLAGAEAVLLLRAILRSGDWNAYWSFHTKAEHRRNHASRYANGEPPALEIPKYSGYLRRVK